MTTSYRVNCIHCAKKLETKDEVMEKKCFKCQALPQCEICSIIMCKMKDHFGRQSKNPSRCVDCEFIEDRVKNVCGFCGEDIINTVDKYKSQGNICPLCTRDVNARYLNEIKGTTTK